jgi:hypothetical protein
LKKAPQPPVVVLKRHQLEPDQEYPAAIPGLLPSQRKNAVIKPDMETGWTDVLWLDVVTPEKTKPEYNYSLIAAAVAAFTLAAYLISGVIF